MTCEFCGLACRWSASARHSTSRQAGWSRLSRRRTPPSASRRRAASSSRQTSCCSSSSGSRRSTPRAARGRPPRWRAQRPPRGPRVAGAFGLFSTRRLVAATPYVPLCVCGCAFVSTERGKQAGTGGVRAAYACSSPLYAGWCESVYMVCCSALDVRRRVARECLVPAERAHAVSWSLKGIYWCFCLCGEFCLSVL